MLKKFIARRISYPLQDRLNGTDIIRTYKYLLQTQYWPQEKLETFQFEKFKKLLEYAYQHVPFYKRLYKDVGIEPGDVKIKDDIIKLPIVTKEQAREYNNEMVSTICNMKKIKKGVTGGTTGPPLKLLRDQKDLSYTWAAYYRWYNWMGIAIGDKVTKIWGTATVLNYPITKLIRDKIKNFYYNRQFINSFNLNESTILRNIKDIEHFKPKLIRGYLSALIQIAEFLEKNNIKINHIPRALSSTTETLLPAFKLLIEKSFGSKLYDQYGCGECNSIAFDAGDNNGLYITMEHSLIEVLDENNNNAGTNDGRIILTNLDNYAMPFIRYENGDWGNLGMKTNQSDINLAILKRISGRSADTIILKDNSKVHGVFFTDILNELFSNNPKFIHRFQVYQDNAGEIEFRIESKQKVDGEYIYKLQNALNRFFNQVKIVYLETLPLDKSGKFRYIISALERK